MNSASLVDEDAPTTARTCYSQKQRGEDDERKVRTTIPLALELSADGRKQRARTVLCAPDRRH